MNIRRLVMDVLKPHNPSMVEIAERVSDLGSVNAVNGTLCEIDEKVENIKLTIVGDNIDEDSVRAEIEEMGGSIHSIDEVICGDEVVEESKTPQDGNGR